MADTNNNYIRKIVISTAEVTTLAGSGSGGFQNGIGTSATFNFPFGLCIDTTGNLFVADTHNHSIRQIALTSTSTLTWTKTGSLGYTGDTGDTGYTGDTGPAGQGVPAGGSQGQVLVKTTGDDYATEWATLSGGGGGGNTESRK